MMETLLIVAASLVLGLGIAAFVVFMTRPPTVPADPAAEQRMVELSTRVQQMGELLAKAQSQLQHTVNERLDSVTQRIGQSMQQTTQNTVENLQKLNERLAVIDNAQKNITDLATQVTSLQSVLTNKQNRGAFGQGHQRPDCCIFLPDKRPLVIDAKFPLEAVTAFRDAQNDEQRKLAAAQVRQHVAKHISDIAEKYLIPGETQDLALMFVPSESVYADLHDGFDDVMQKAFRSQVVIVSPSLLMLAIHVIQQIQKDARMREAADKIHAEVGHLIDDIGRLGERVRKLQQHSNQTSEDIRQILISTEKIEKRGERIREVEFDGDEAALPPNVTPLRRLEAGE
jgi:DNA recombination protein RmuC